MPPVFGKGTDHSAVLRRPFSRGVVFFPGSASSARRTAYGQLALPLVSCLSDSPGLWACRKPMDVEHRVWWKTAIPPVFGKEITHQGRIAFQRTCAGLRLICRVPDGISFPYEGAVFFVLGQSADESEVVCSWSCLLCRAAWRDRQCRSARGRGHLRNHGHYSEVEGDHQLACVGGTWDSQHIHCMRTTA
jgi:hypothetical protein